MTMQQDNVTYLEIDVTPRTRSRVLPFSRRSDVEVTARQWAAILAAVAAAALVDLFLVVPGPPALAIASRGTLFAGIPLLVYLSVLPDHWKTIFGQLRGTDVRTMLLVFVANLVVSMAVGAVLHELTSTASNPVGDDIRSLGVGGRLVYLASMIPQLFGEELFTILILLAVASLTSWRWHWSPTAALAAGITVSTLAFAALHLTTYDWNVLQCLIGIGVARIVLLVAYLRTKNILVSTGSHVLNDWALFSVALLGH